MTRSRSGLLISAAPLLALATGCAGPYTPFGALQTWVPASPNELGVPHVLASAPPSSPNAPRIEVQPAHQVLHGPAPMRLVIHDPAVDFRDYDFMVRYNGFDVTKSFIRRAHFTESYADRSIVIEKRALRLAPTSEHLIDFTYRNARGTFAYASYEAPTCNAFKPAELRNTADFKPSPELLKQIDELTRREGFNPAFFAGLIAQESRFDPNQVSWARAIGLTQITDSAETEIAEIHSEWPRYPHIADKDTELLRVLILSGRLNARNEWRLNPALSIRGAMTYTRLLVDRWSTASNLERIHAISLDPDTELARLVLASYNSGYSRVSKALEEMGRDWIKSPDLKEARKYVNKIFSYCNYFTQPTEFNSTVTTTTEPTKTSLSRESLHASTPHGV